MRDESLHVAIWSEATQILTTTRTFDMNGHCQLIDTQEDTQRHWYFLVLFKRLQSTSCKMERCTRWAMGWLCYCLWWFLHCFVFCLWLGTPAVINLHQGILCVTVFSTINNNVTLLCCHFYSNTRWRFCNKLYLLCHIMQTETELQQWMLCWRSIVIFLVNQY